MERESQLEVIQAHIDFFNEIGGVPKTIFYDNLKTVVDKPGKIINENFLKFASFFNFTPNACNPYSPNEKGPDEETVGMLSPALVRKIILTLWMMQINT
ncbi:MAG: hypothetical protein AB7E28_05800 [Desulfurella sp.]|jgi:transposase